MKEHTRTWRLIVVTIIFVFVLIIGFLTIHKPTFEYSLSTDETLLELFNPNNEITPKAFSEIIGNRESSVAIVDLRNLYEYGRGYLGTAINIPVSDILSEESISFFMEMKKNSTTVVLYGSDQLQSNGPWMLLSQLGFSNVKILQGGYDCYASKDVDISDYHEIQYLSLEDPYMDFGKFIESVSGNNEGLNLQQNETKQIVPVKRKKKTVSAGGC